MLLLMVLLAGVGVWLFRDSLSDSGGRRCGWTVQGTVVLDRDVLDCDHHGVRLAPFARLDCAGHEIRAREGGSDGYGVRLDAVEQAQVRNCRISGFARGIRIRGGQDNLAVGNVLTGNGHGIEIAGKTDGGRSERHRISGNEIEDSRRDGVHVGAGTSHTVIVGNTIRASGEEGVALEGCRSCEMTDNVIEASGSAAVDLKNSTGGRYLRNRVSGSLFKIRGASARNLLEDNQLEDSGFVLAAVGKPGPTGTEGLVPTRNRIVGGSISGSKVCFRFRGAQDNAVVGVTVSGCELRIDDTGGGWESSGNTLLDVEVLEPRSS